MAPKRRGRVPAADSDGDDDVEPQKDAKPTKRARHTAPAAGPSPTAATPAATPRPVSIPFDKPIAARLHGPPSPKSLVVVSHGAGGSHDSPDIASLSAALAAAMPDRGVLAWAGTTMNLAHRARELGAVVEWARKEFKLESIYLVGRSMGCRASAKYALEDAEMLVKGLAFLSYPLVAGGRGAAPEPADKKAKGKPGKKDDRASLLSDLARTRPDVPLLFFRGTADPMLPSAALSAALRDAFAISELDISLAACQGADHGLKVKGKGAKERSEGLEKAVVEKIVAWIAVGRVAGKGAREEELSF